ncbi:MAG TPA: hypothetical protein VFR47_14170 [Anaerolineales bacterium]|nr:hypothetical protein [Anaerolineales bacterium]
MKKRLLPFWAEWNHGEQVLCREFHGFSRIYFRTSHEFVKSVAEVLVFPVKNGRTEIRKKLCRSAGSVYKEALHPEYGKAIAAPAQCLLEKHTLMENKPSSRTSKR